MDMELLRIGTCGFCGRRREHYDAFGVVELQATSSQPHHLTTAQRWRAEAPPQFEFTLVALPAITHGPESPAHRRHRLSAAERARCGGFRDTPVVRRAWKATLELARALDAKIVVFKTPASFRPTEESMADLFRFFQWAHRDRLHLGWEPRGEAWSDELIREACRELSLTHVVDPLQRETLRGRPPYFRLRGMAGTRHRYTDEELARLHALCSGRPGYCMFGNATRRGDAERLTRLVRDGERSRSS